MGPKRKNHTKKTAAETASSAGSISVENGVASQAVAAAAGRDASTSSRYRERGGGGGDGTTSLANKNKQKKNRGHHQQQQHTSRAATTKESHHHHHHHQSSRKRSLRQRQQEQSSSALSSATAAVKNAGINSNVQDDDDIEEQLKRQRQKQAEKEKLKDFDDPSKSDDASAATALPLETLGMYRYHAKRQAYFPAGHSFSLRDEDDDMNMNINRHCPRSPGETCSSLSPVVSPRRRTFPHTPPLLERNMELAKPSSTSTSPSCSFAYPVASCGDLSQRLGLVSTWAGQAVLESFGWTPSAAFLPCSRRTTGGGRGGARSWHFLHGMNSNIQASSNSSSIIVRPVDIDCKIGTVSWTRTFDVQQWPNCNTDKNRGSDSFLQPPRVVTVTDVDYVVQQHGKPQGRHVDFSRHCLGASVHSPRFLDTDLGRNASGSNNSSSATTFSLLGTLDSAHGRSSLRLHKLFNVEDDEDSNDADVVFNFSSAQNDFVNCANDSLVFAPVMHHHHARNTNQQASQHRQGNGNENVRDNNNNGYVPWLLCIEHGSFGAIQNRNVNRDGLFPNSEALCVEADPSYPNCFYFGHRNGQVTLFDIKSGCGQSTQQESVAFSAPTTTASTNRSSLPFFGSITSIHALSSSLSPRQVLVRGGQGSCRLHDFRKLCGGSSSSSSSSSSTKGKHRGHNHRDPSLVYEMTPLPLLADNNPYDDYARGIHHNHSNSDEGGGSSHGQRRHRRRQVQRLTNRCNGVVTNPEETVVISPYVQVQGADQVEMPSLGFWSLHSGDWIGSKPLAPSSLTAGNDNEQFPATTSWSVAWVELSKRITPAWQWRKRALDDCQQNDDVYAQDKNERDKENDAGVRPRPGSFGLWYKCGQSMAGPGLPPAAGSIHHVYATGNPDS
jgi:hypothetical protein